MKCSFCKKTVEKGKGKVYIKHNGKILSFCSSKCEKYMLKLRKKALRVPWTKNKK